MNIRKILFATDLSERSDRAFRRALMLAREHDARLTILYVIDEDLPAPMKEAMQERAHEFLTAQLAAAKPRYKKATISIVNGHSYLSVIEEITKSKTDLLVTGIHRKATLRNLFKDSTGQKLVQLSPVPVLVVKNPANKVYKNIVVGMDFSDQAKKALHMASCIVPKSKLTIAHAFSVPFRGMISDKRLLNQEVLEHTKELKKTVQAVLKKAATPQKQCLKKADLLLEENLPSTLMHKYIRTKKADLLVIGAHTRPSLVTDILGSQAQEMISNAKCDVLITK